ncbi:MAG: NADH-quinone oxidoreductase subunit E [Pseudonocardiales bacterium]|nr:MAG: NADH-quinone oxidoreductase subunit E [Pseudonocardiales bacterium]
MNAMGVDTGSRLLPVSGSGGRLRDLRAHEQVHGRLPNTGAADLIAAVRDAGLTGRGGAAFPTHRKLSAVAAGRHPVVVANAAEGEPVSGKDQLLLSAAPHLVLDGLQLAARAVGARDAVVYVHAGPLVALMRDLVARRAADRVDAVAVRVVDAPARFISGQESAVVSRLNGGSALPRTVPPAVFQKGVGGRPTLVQNVETLAHLALIARNGPAWFRSRGTAEEPGTMLLTIGGAVHAPGVVEADIGTPVGMLLGLGGGPSRQVQALLIGGYHGTWLPAEDLPISVAGLRPYGATPGAGVLVALPSDVCGLVETARAVGYLAGESAGQCGPCRSGLPALAATMRGLATPGRAGAAPERIAQLAGLVEGRGACHHPDGTARFVRSALAVFHDEIVAHQDGWCRATHPAPVLPIPSTGSGAR